jgi:D-sedoheptulose 7-phosphate isomerase
MEATKETTGIAETLLESARVKNELAKDIREIEKIAAVLIDAYKRGNKMVLFGNGGSAADAQHIATELVSGFTIHDRKSLPALALTTDTSALTAIGNDFSYDVVFSRQVESMVVPGDVVIGISTSGNSKNVIEALRMAKRLLQESQAGSLESVLGMAAAMQPLAHRDPEHADRIAKWRTEPR